MSDAGRLITSRQLPASLADSVQRLGKAELGSSKLPAGRSALVVKLAGVGNPFVDEDQAGAELVEQLAQYITRIRRVLVVGRDPVERLPAAQFATPSRPTAFGRSLPSGFVHRIARGDLVADQHHPPCRPKLRCLRPPGVRRQPRPVPPAPNRRNRWYRASMEWVLPPPKLVCNWTTGVAALPRDATDCPDQQALQGFPSGRCVGRNSTGSR